MNNNDIVPASENNEITKGPIAGFDTHPENINRKGRPKKGHSITETIRSMMDEKPELKKILANRILQMAASGDITAMKTIWNYLDGMPLQKTDITSDGEKIGGPILYAPTRQSVTIGGGSTLGTGGVASTSETGTSTPTN